MKIAKIRKLLELDKEWQKEFKASLIEGVLRQYNNIDEFLEVALNDWFPIWKEENPDLIDIYKSFEKRLEIIKG